MNEVDKLLAVSLLGDGEALEQLESGYSLQLLIERLEYHGVSALLYEACRQKDSWFRLSKELQLYLDVTAKQFAAVDLSRRHEERRVLSALTAANVPAIIIKGAALSRTHYASPGLRSRSDSDVLIPLTGIEKSLGVFQALGYRLSGTGYRSHQFECRGTAPGGLPVMFDVHWRISNSPRYARRFQFEELFERSVEVDDEGFNIRVTSVVDSLVIALMHRVANPFHDKDRLIWLYDIYLLLSAMSASEVDDAVSMIHSKDIVNAGIEGGRVTQAYFPGEKNQVFLERLESLPVDTESASRFNQSYAGLIWDDMKVLPNWKTRFSLIKELILPPADFMMNKYGFQSRMMLPLLYVWRLMSVGVKRVLLK